MKRYLPFMLATLSVVPVGAQSPPSTSAPASSATTKPCDPVDPEILPGGEPVYTGCQIKALGGSLPKLESAPKSPDLSDLYRRGIQGEVFVSLVIGKDGRSRDVSIKRSSRSPELDAIGLQIANISTFSPATDRDGKPMDARAIYPIHFWKDSIGNKEFTNKRCDQFLIDADWHQSNFPEEKPDQYRGWLLASGLFFMASMDLGGPKNPAVKVGGRKTATYAEVVETCRNHPDKLFFDVLGGK